MKGFYRTKHLNSGALGPNIDRIRTMIEPVCKIISVTIKNNSSKSEHSLLLKD